MAFWEYILYLEIIRKLLEKDRSRHLTDHTIFETYKNLEARYGEECQIAGGDFSERLWMLSDRIADWFGDRLENSEEIRLGAADITNFLYKTDINQLRNDLVEYLNNKNETWLLFDNLDKGWPASGLTDDDALILRCLIESARKIQNDLRGRGCDFTAEVMIRDDVYDFLIRRTPDYGKEVRVQLEWRDRELLREMVRARLVVNGFERDTGLDKIWPSICVSHILDGIETLEYLIDHCLMRPRNLIKIIEFCKGFAINFSHDKITEDDVMRGLDSYSNELLIEADRELSDVHPPAEGLLYQFVGEKAKYSIDELTAFLEMHRISTEQRERVMEQLIYFGFFGIIVNGQEKYVWDYGNNFGLMKAAMGKAASGLEYILNPAFHPALGI